MIPRAVLAGLVAMLLAACGVAAPRAAPGLSATASATVYVVRRGWHTDIGFAADALPGPLAGLARDFPGVRYLVFGFGDRRYLLMRDKASGSALALFWPERGLILATGLKVPPAEAFGAGNVVALALSQKQLGDLADFVWQSLQRSPDGGARPYADGPYAGSLFYDSTRVYSGVRTCNTWTAQALHAAGLPVDSFGVLFAAQLWAQVQRLRSD